MEANKRKTAKTCHKQVVATMETIESLDPQETTAEIYALDALTHLSRAKGALEMLCQFYRYHHHSKPPPEEVHRDLP